jgi:hypothetical protein
MHAVNIHGTYICVRDYCNCLKEYMLTRCSCLGHTNMRSVHSSPNLQLEFFLRGRQRTPSLYAPDELRKPASPTAMSMDPSLGSSPWTHTHTYTWLQNMTTKTNRRIPVSHKYPLGINPGSLMTGSKQVDHWTSGTVWMQRDCRLSSGLPPSSRLCWLWSRKEDLQWERN